MANNTYTPINWINGPGGGTPINATNLNRMEAGISKAYDAIFTTVPNDSAIKAEITAAKNAAIQQAHEKDNAVKTEIANTYAKKTEIPNVSNFVTTTELTAHYYTVEETDTAISDAIDKITIPDLKGYAKKTDIPTKVSAFENDKNYLTQQSLDGYATEAFVAEKIAEAELSGGGDVDLSNYYTRSETDTKFVTNDLISTNAGMNVPSESKPKAEGITSIAIGYEAYAEFEDSVAIGYGAYSSEDAQIAIGRYNDETAEKVFIIGNGESHKNRSNAHTLDWDGNAWFAGGVTVSTVDEDGVPEFTPTQENHLTTKFYVDNEIAGLQNDIKQQITDMLLNGTW